MPQTPGFSRGINRCSHEDDQLWFREIRKLRADGQQAAVISADWQAGAAQIAGPRFGRWYQENFFKYGREHFNLDRQIETLDPGTDLRMIFRSVSS